MQRHEAKSISVEVWKDGRRSKVIDCGDDRRRALSLFGAMARLSTGARPVLVVDGRELRTAAAMRYLKSGRLPYAVD